MRLRDKITNFNNLLLFHPKYLIEFGRDGKNGHSAMV